VLRSWEASEEGVCVHRLAAARRVAIACHTRVNCAAWGSGALAGAAAHLGHVRHAQQVHVCDATWCCGVGSLEHRHVVAQALRQSDDLRICNTPDAIQPVCKCTFVHPRAVQFLAMQSSSEGYMQLYRVSSK
jgi:hypothetical protein